MLYLAFALYCIASAIHFAHNALYIAEYPNLPASLTSVGVAASWCAITAVGMIGIWVERLRSQRAGLALIGFYATLGFGGLDHYAVATIAAHSVAMNGTILFEAVAAVLLLGTVVDMWLKLQRSTRA